MKKHRLAPMAGSLLTALGTLVGAVGIEAEASADTQIHLRSSKDVPLQTAAIVAGGFPLGRGDVQTSIAFANHQLGFGPANLPDSFNFVASGKHLNLIVDFNHAFGKENVSEIFQDGKSLGTITVQHVVAPLMANRLDPAVSGILYCTRELKSGIVRYRIVVRYQNKADYLKEFGVMDDGNFYEMSHKHGDASFAMTFDTVLKKNNSKVYQQTMNDMSGTPSLFSQAKVLVAGQKNFTELQNARLEADSKKLGDALKNVWSAAQAIIDAIKKLVDALKAVFDVLKGILSSLFGWL